jgi:hypothetical protein
MALAQRSGGLHIGIVISGHETYVRSRPQFIEPAARVLEFRRQRDIDEIAGHRDVVGPLAPEVAHDRRRHVAAMDGAALAKPVEISGEPLRCELGDPWPGQGSEMRIGQVCQHEHVATEHVAAGRLASEHVASNHLAHELPIRMPARNTSAPPMTTWNAAVRNDVSM